MLRGLDVELTRTVSAPWRIDELPGGWRVVSSNGFTLACIYSVDSIARSADPLKLNARPDDVENLTKDALFASKFAPCFSAN